MYGVVLWTRFNFLGIRLYGWVFEYGSALLEFFDRIGNYQVLGVNPQLRRCSVSTRDMYFIPRAPVILLELF
jgi:hypothetical protein